MTLLALAASATGVADRQSEQINIQLDVPWKQSVAELRQGSFSTVRLAVSTATTLAIATKAFQGQLEVCSKQPTLNRLPGYKSFPMKQRLEYHPGDKVLGALGVLQHLATTVTQFASLFFNPEGFVTTLLSCVYRWFKFLMRWRRVS